MLIKDYKENIPIQTKMGGCFRDSVNLIEHGLVIKPAVQLKY